MRSLTTTAAASEPHETTPSGDLLARVAAASTEPPDERAGSVVRTRPLARLQEAADVPLVTIVAPPGYGKTTIVAQWAHRDLRPFAWLTLEDRDNDPAVLLAALAGALDRALVAALDPRDHGVVVFDDVATISSPPSQALLAVVVEGLHRRWQAVVISREPIRGLSVARRRAEGRILELTAADLAMDQQEAAALVAGAGATLGRQDVAALTRRTEGWPAALALTALAARDDARRDGVREGAGADRLLADYVRAEVLSGLSVDTTAFLRRTSPLERLSGPLCDAVLDAAGSAARLAALAERNQLVIPLGERGWYRYHPVLRDVLLVAVQEHEPDLVADGRRRAADWHEAHGQSRLAADQAMALGDAARVLRIVATSGQAVARRGDVETVERWVDWIDARGLVDQSVQPAIVGAWAHVLVGHAAAAERWTDGAARALAREDPAGAGPGRGPVLTLEAALCRDGVGPMRAAAAEACRLITVASPWRAGALLMVGIAELLAGRPVRADLAFADAADVAEDVGATYAGSVALAERALLALDRGEVDTASALAERARAIADEAGLQEAATSAFVYAVAGRTRLARADVAGARVVLAAAQRLRPRLSHALPHLAVQARLQLVRCATLQTDVAGARTVFREIDDILARRPLLGGLVAEVQAARAQLAVLRADIVGATSLTAAELRLLPLLSTYMSFQEIGARLYVSRNTVKTEALSIYRKLGVSSRGAAIERATDLGLLTP